MEQTSKRCAIYTRKSSDEGLDQAFNSLHAQRSACEAYIRSQAGEGWSCLPDYYDDGGFSGATMDRPALRRLLADIVGGHVDVVVVYKIDRLTRSLGDFARIVEQLEQASASFVSVTQAFNTTSSMGKLTLNVLLSFAQFERDVTSERIRDKIQASKSRGLWMGGLPPIGYRPSTSGERTLVIVPSEADTVRQIFRHLLELGSIAAVQKALAASDTRSKVWITADGRRLGGFSWSRGALRYLLRNRIYLGQIAHKDIVYKGRHEAIIDQATFDAVQSILAGNSELQRTRTKKSDQLLMAGLLFDADGQSMEPRFTKRKGRASGYSYYVSKPFPGSVDEDGREDAIRRVPVRVIDSLARTMSGRVLDRSADELSRADIRKVIRRMDVLPAAVHFTIRSTELPGRMTSSEVFSYLRSRTHPTEQIVADPSHLGLVRLLLPIRLVSRGGRTWLHGADGRPIEPPRQPDTKSVTMLQRSHRLRAGTGADPTSIKPPTVVRTPKSPADRKALELAFLAPDLQKAVLRGELRLPADLPRPLPLSWVRQRELFARSGPGGQKPTSRF
jgi:site-specific DNA recombinase